MFDSVSETSRAASPRPLTHVSRLRCTDRCRNAGETADNTTRLLSSKCTLVASCGMSFGNARSFVAVSTTDWSASAIY